MAINPISVSNNYKKFIVDDKLQYFKPHSSKIEKTFSEEITDSLSQEKKSINPKFFYDEIGSRLFEQICELEEYYLTRTEVKILKKIRDELPDLLLGEYRLVELGSGSSTKTRLILDALNKNNCSFEYFPIDISEILTESSSLLQKDYENLHIVGIIDTYEGGLEFLKNYDEKNNLVIFLGSSYGNFEPKDGKLFLQKINETLKKEDQFLIGLDLVKEKSILENAYDDSKGITAKFNLNVLARINDELDGNFNLNNFSHKAFYDEKNQRIAIYIQSKINQTVILAKPNLSLQFKKDELIHTEYSHKYSIPQIKDLMDSTGFKIKKIWCDEKNYFCVVLASKNF